MYTREIITDYLCMQNCIDVARLKRLLLSCYFVGMKQLPEMLHVSRDYYLLYIQPRYFNGMLQLVDMLQYSKWTQ